MPPVTVATGAGIGLGATVGAWEERRSGTIKPTSENHNRRMRSSWYEAFARTVRARDQAAVKPVVVVERRFQQEGLSLGLGAHKAKR